MDICLICLRTDRKLKVVSNVLSKYHHELCGYSICIVDPQYCTECEYLLRKWLNFKEKCIKAMNIYQEWQESNSDESMLLDLYKLLQPTSLGIWNPSEAKNAMYYYKDVSRPMLCIDEEFIKNTLSSTETKTELGEIDITESNYQDFPTSKTEESSYLIDNSLLENDTNYLNINADISERIDIEQQNESDNIVVDDHLDDCCINGNNKNRNRNKHDILNSYIFFDHSYCTVEENQISPSSRTENIPVYDDNCETESIQRTETSKDVRDEKKIKKRKRIRKKIIKVDNKSLFTKKSIMNELVKTIDLGTKELGGNTTMKKKLPFSKERLKAELIIKFASCGELKTSDGTVIDKEFVFNCLEDKVKNTVMKSLWTALRDQSDIGTNALRIFQTIQTRYKEDLTFMSVFDIEYLTNNEKVMEEFQKRKTYESYLRAEYKCDICYQPFKYEKSLKNHQKYHEESAGDFACSVCRVRCKTRRRCNHHVAITHDAVHKCKLCPLVTHYRQSQNDSEIAQEKETPSDSTSASEIRPLEKKAPRNSTGMSCLLHSMINHYHQHKGKEYKCDPCNAIFKSLSAFRSHNFCRHSHGGNVCPACGRSYVLKALLDSHMAHKHRGVYRYNRNTGGDARARCEDCELAFPSKEDYYRHLRTLHKKKWSIAKEKHAKLRRKAVIICRVCNAVGGSNGWLTQHFRREHPSVDMSATYSDKKTHLCHICGQGFTKTYTLRSHLNMHTGTRPYACDTCPKHFHSSLNLAQHRLRHFPPSIKCPECAKKFHSKSNLHNHMRTHSDDRRYKCSVCEKRFRHSATLKEHLEGVHQNLKKIKVTKSKLKQRQQLQEQVEVESQNDDEVYSMEDEEEWNDEQITVMSSLDIS